VAQVSKKEIGFIISCCTSRCLKAGGKQTFTHRLLLFRSERTQQ